MSDAPDDLGIPMKPARASTQAATVAPLGRSTPAPSRVPDTPRPAPDTPRSVESSPRPIAPPPVAARRTDTDTDVRKLIVGREITLSGEITACDKLIIEGSVEANLQNCQDVDIAESGLFKGTATIEEVEVRGRFEGNLIVRKRLMIRSTGRVSGTIRYGQIEIEAGGQISGDIQAQSSEDFMSDVPGTRAPF